MNFRLSGLNNYQTYSYLDDLSATFVEFEAATHFDLGPFEVENRTILNVADLPSEIVLGPTNPFGTSGTGRASGFGEILSATFFSPKNGHKNYHLGIGPVFTFPTATEAGLGSEKWAVGPGAHFHTDLGKLTVGFFLWQSWSFAGDASKKEVNQLFGKPFLLYELSEKWNLVSIPLGLSHSWRSKSGERTTIPIGGGVRRLFKCHGHTLGLQAQVFDYVVRKPKDPEWELRFTIELIFDE